MSSVRLAVAVAGIATLALSLPAQKTWTTGVAELPATIEAAASGDVLLVAGDGWTPTGLTIRKPLSIHGLPGARVIVPPPGLLIEDIGLGQTTVIQGFSVGAQITVRRCAGTVLLADLANATSFRVVVEDSLDVALESCRFDVTGAYGTAAVSVAAINSSLTLSQTAVRAASFGIGSAVVPLPALAALDSVVRVAQCRLTGGSSDVPFHILPQPAISLLSSTLRLSGARSSIVAGTNNAVPVSAIDGTGTLVLDPAAVLVPSTSAPPVGSGIQVASRAHPTTSVTPSPVGGSATITVRGNPGDACWLLFGSPALPTSFAGVLGELRIGAGLTVVTSGQLDLGGELGLTFPVPAIAALRAITFRWQGVTGNATTTFLAEPGTECHR